MKHFASLLLALFMLPVVAQQGTTGMPAPVLSGNGVPGTTLGSCTSTAYANLNYYQTDSTTGYVWVCMPVSGVWQWYHLISPIAIATTTSITAGTFLLGGCTAITTVAIAGATVGTNSATANPIFASAPSGNMGAFNVTAWVSAAGIVSVQGCALTALSSVPNFQARVLMY